MKRTYSGAAYPASQRSAWTTQETRSRSSSRGSDLGYAGRGVPTRRYKTQKVSKPLKIAIERVITRNEEKKTNNFYSNGNSIQGVAGGGWSTSPIPICPNSTGFQIPQGTGQGQRIGNQIKVKKMILKVILQANPYNLTTNPTPQPFQCRMILMKDKLGPTSTPTNLTTELFNSSSTSIGPTNDLVDMLLPINKDRYQIYFDEVIKVGPQFYTGSGQNANYGSGSNNDFLLNPLIEVDCTKFIPSKVQFDDTSSNPTSHGLWLLFIPANSDGTAILSTTVVGGYTYSTELDFTDA